MILTLVTDRLTLRPLAPPDFPDFARLMGSERARHMGGPLDRAAAWGVFCHEVAGWALFGAGGLAIEAEGGVVGAIEINQGPLFPEPELGWQLYEGAEGRGYATEAAAALRDWVFAAGLVPTLVSYVHPDNRRSARVAERLGGTLDPDAPRQEGDETDLVYRYRRRPA